MTAGGSDTGTAYRELRALPTLRPPILARRFAVSSGHYLASLAGVSILERGGNAIDAGVAAGLVINVVQSEYTNLGGVAPIIIYLAETDEVVTIAGIGTWPKAASIEWFRAQGHAQLPLGIPSAVVPAAVDAWLTALARYGTMSLREVAAPAIELAAEGFPVHQFLHDNLQLYYEVLSELPTNRAVYFPNDRVPDVGEMLVQADLAKTMTMLCEAEGQSTHLGRSAAIMAARDLFYRGEIAERLVAFCQQEGGLLTMEDLDEYAVEVAPPLSIDYRGHTVYSCGPWCQGPVVLQALSILRGFDLRQLEQNSVRSLHLIAEALKLSFADRQRWYGDPRHVEVPVDRLLSETYSAERRRLIDEGRAWDRMPPAGDGTVPGGMAQTEMTLAGPDTSYVSVVDSAGNAFSATPSDGASTTPIVPGLGFAVSDRGRQSWLDPENPAALGPGRRPRLTPSPGLVRRGTSFVMPYGTPGGEIQPQAMTQVLVNMFDFGMDAQEAIEAPRIATFSHPDSGSPHRSQPGVLRGESRLGNVLTELEKLGHRLVPWPAWTPLAGSVCAVAAYRDRGLLVGAADLRRISYAIGR